MKKFVIEKLDRLIKRGHSLVTKAKPTQVEGLKTIQETGELAEWEAEIAEIFEDPEAKAVPELAEKMKWLATKKGYHISVALDKIDTLTELRLLLNSKQKSTEIKAEIPIIQSVSLRNFKAFKGELELALAPLTLFTGMNGMGKSSAIQTLLLARQSYQQNSLQLVGKYLDLGRGKDVQNIYAIEDTVGIKISWNNGDVLDQTYKYNANSDNLPLIGELQHEKHKTKSIFSDGFQYLSADRLAPKSFFPTSTGDVEQRRFLGVHGEYTAHFVSYWQREEIKETALLHPKAKGKELIHQLSAWLAEITPSVSLVANTLDDLDLARLGYTFETTDDKTPAFRPTNVGFGFTHVLPILTAVLAAQKGDLIIVENPESHLHPQGQVVLGRLFAKAAAAGIQIILESHSDHILNAICVAVKKKIIKSEGTAVYYFERNIQEQQHQTKVINPQILPTGRLSQYPKGFFDEYDKQLDELLG